MKRLLLVATLSLLASVASFSQTTNVKSGPADGRTPLALQPGTPEGSYALSGFESVSLYSGKVNVAVPLLTIGGRGSSGYTMKVPIQSISWSAQVDTSLGPGPEETSRSYAHGSGAVWSAGGSLYRAWYGPGMLVAKRGATAPTPCPGTTVMGQTFTLVVFLEPDGTEHELYSKNGLGVSTPNCSGTGTIHARGAEFVAYDDSGTRFVSSSAVLEDATDAESYDAGAEYNPLDASGTLFFRNGTRYLVQGGLVQEIVDRNGNRTTFSYATRNGGGPSLGSVFVSQITDAAGRQYFIDYLVTDEPGCAASTVQCDRLRFRGEDNAARKVIVRYEYLSNRLRSDFSMPAKLFPNLLGTEQPVASEFVLSEITLPNSAAWKFYYSPYGEIAKVVLPTGGAIEYDHGAGLSNAGAVAGTYASGQILDDVSGQSGAVNLTMETPPPRWRPVIYRRLWERREYNSVISGEGSGKRTDSAFKTSSYPRFESASSPIYDTILTTKVADLIITAQDAVTVQHTGVNAGAAVSETHKFHGDYSFGALGSDFSPARSIKFGAQPTSPWLATYPDVFSGKEYHTAIGGLRTVERVFGAEENGRTARVCQENITLTEPGSPALTSGKVFFYDTQATGSKFTNSAYWLGNQTELYEYPFGAAPAITTTTSGSLTYRQCYATAPANFLRRTRTDYLQDANYLSPTTYLTSLVVQERIYGPGGQLTQTDYSHDQADKVPDPYSSFTVAQTAFCGASAKAERGNVNTISRLVKDLPGGGNPSTVTAAFWYDCAGNVTKHQLPKGNATEYFYADDFLSSPAELGTAKSFAFLTRIKLPYAFETTRKYDFYSGKPRQETDPNGLVTTFSHADSLNRLKEIVRGSGASGSIPAKTTVNYLDTPQTGAVATTVEVKKDQYGADQRLVEQTGYDAFGRAVHAVTAGDETIETVTEFDGLGRVYSQCNPRKPGVASSTDGCYTNTYDGLGRLVQRQGPDGSLMSQAYANQSDASPPYAAALTTITDEAQKTRQLHHDAFGRLIRVVEAPGVASYGFVTNYSYDPLDNLTDVFHGDRPPRHFEYDSLKRLRLASNPESGTITYAFDANGNLIRRTDARNVMTCYGSISGGVCDGGYDNLDRVTRINYSDGTPEVHHCYDGASYAAGACSGSAAGQKLRKTASGNSVSSTSYTFDLAGRLTNSAQTLPGTTTPYSFTYSFYHDDRLASLRYPSERTVTTCYDRNGRVSWTSKDRTPSDCQNGTGTANPVYAAVGAYAPPGAITSLTLGNLVETSSYNSRLQPVTMQAGSLLTLTFAYSDPGQNNNNGNVRSQQMQAGSFNVTQNYDYDPLNRLQMASEGSAWSRTFNYDPYGNMWVTNAEGIVPGAETPSASSWFDTNNRLVGNGYDFAGNLTGANGWTYAYDAENRLVSATTTISGTTYTNTYSYDGEGRRVAKSANGVATWFVYDGFGNLAAEYGGTLETTGTHYLTQDHLGSTRLITDGSGQPVTRQDFLPFGEEIGATIGGRAAVPAYGGPDVTPLKFTGKERDNESGLDYFGARYYFAAQGKWISPDRPFNDQFPQDPQSWNLYAYVRNHPLVMIDHDGDSATVIGGISGALIGGAIAWYRGQSIAKGAASGFVAGALAGAVIDTGGAALGVYGAAAAGGALGSVAGGVVARGLDGKETTVTQAAVEGAVGAAAGMTGTAVGKGVAAVTAKVKDAIVQSQAVGAHDALGIGSIAFQNRTTAVARIVTHDGKVVTVAASSEGALTAAQKAALPKGTVFLSGERGVHAEQKILQYAQQTGAQVQRIGTAPRNPCPTCETQLQQQGVRHERPYSR
jgi:RHS repeat-associated protein